MYVDVHQWIEHTLLAENNTCLMCLTYFGEKASYEATQIEVIIYLVCIEEGWHRNLMFNL